MPVEVKIPELGESISEVVLTTWHKAEGDWVEKDEGLFEVESDKITTDVPAPESGVISLKADAGAELEVGAVVASIDPDAEKPKQATGGAKKKAAGKDADEDDGADESEAATATATKQSKKEPAKSPPPAKSKSAAKSQQAAGAAESRENGLIRATPVARRMAEDQGIDLNRVRGTGPGGRITKEDILDAASSSSSSTSSTPSAKVERRDGRRSAAPPTGERGVRREKMSKLRQRIAERLVYAKNSTAMLTTFNECDMSAVVALRKKYKETFEEKHGVSLGFMSFFAKACCSALREFPRVNAYIVEDAFEYHDYVDLSVAVSTEKGLTVPILRDVDALSFAEIEAGIKDLAIRARDGELTMDDLTGGTFTITNGGVFGSLQSTPILNPPQSGILGMHAIKNRAVEDPANPGQIVLRPMMYLALSYDHRIVDGKEAVSFLVHVKECIEDPQRLLFEM